MADRPAARARAAFHVSRGVVGSSSVCWGIDLARHTGPVPKLGLDVLDGEADHAPVRELEDDVAARILRLCRRLEAHRQQRENGVTACLVDALDLGRPHALEAQRSAPAHEFGPPILAVQQRLGPVEAVADGSEAPLPRQVGDVAHLDEGVLQVRGDHRQVVGIERDELQLGHGNRRPPRRWRAPVP